MSWRLITDFSLLTPKRPNTLEPLPSISPGASMDPRPPSPFGLRRGCQRSDKNEGQCVAGCRLSEFQRGLGGRAKHDRDDLRSGVRFSGTAPSGVTVTATSPKLQGTRETVTSENGDYILTLLPSGPYTVVFELAGFQRQERSVGLAPTQVLPLQVEMGVAGLTEAVQVVGVPPTCSRRPARSPRTSIRR